MFFVNTASLVGLVCAFASLLTGDGQWCDEEAASEAD